MWFDNDIFEGLEDEDEERLAISRKMNQINAAKASLSMTTKRTREETSYDTDEHSEDFGPVNKKSKPLVDQALAVAQGDIDADPEVTFILILFLVYYFCI